MRCLFIICDDENIIWGSGKRDSSKMEGTEMMHFKNSILCQMEWDWVVREAEGLHVSKWK